MSSSIPGLSDPQSSNASPFYEVDGFISKVGEGVGRNDNDRQFVFVNNRPVDLAKVTKVLNECWRRFEMKQRPAFVLNILVPPGRLDVNLSPDKREVVILHETLLLQRLREHVDELYAPSRSTFKVGMGLVTTHMEPVLSHFEESKSDRNALFPDAPPPSVDLVKHDAIHDDDKEEGKDAEGSDSAQTEADACSVQREVLYPEKPVSAWDFDVAEALEKFKCLYSKPAVPDVASQLYASPAKLRPADSNTEVPMTSPSKVLSRVLSKNVIKRTTICFAYLIIFRTSPAWR